jgi:hypothetical protein
MYIDRGYIQGLRLKTTQMSASHETADAYGSYIIRVQKRGVVISLSNTAGEGTMIFVKGEYDFTVRPSSGTLWHSDGNSSGSLTCHAGRSYIFIKGTGGQWWEFYCSPG